MKKCKNIECNNSIEKNRIYCSLKCRNVYVNKYLRDYTKNSNGVQKKIQEKKREYEKLPKLCLNCNETISYDKKNNKFCSNSCSAIYTNKNRTTKKYTLTADGYKNIVKSNNEKRLIREERYYKAPNKCKVCNKVLVYTKRTNSTCRDKCKSQLLSRLATLNPNCGGETNYRKFQYKGIWMDSSWEVDLAKWLDVKKIKWKRSRKLILYWTDDKDNKRRYYPDFYLPELDLYLDPKNEYKLEQDKEKLKRVIKENDIKILIGNVSEIQNKINYENKNR